jgi:hypothetical protein
VGDFVFLMLHPYMQYSLKKSNAENIKTHFYDPYRVIRRIGEVDYELKLPEGSKIHNLFHVLFFLKSIGEIGHYFDRLFSIG